MKLLSPLSLVTLLVSSVALAEPSPADKETARNLMIEGDERFEARDFAWALRAYQAAHAIMQVPTTGLPLAKAQIERGMLVEARETLLKVTGYPTDPNEPPAFRKAREEAAPLAQKLAERIPSVSITVDGPPSGSPVDVTVDGSKIPADALGTPRKVNPGPHLITAYTKGFLPSIRSASLKEGDNVTVALTLAPGEGEPPVLSRGTSDESFSLATSSPEPDHRSGQGQTAQDAGARSRDGLHFGVALAPAMELRFAGGGPLYGGAGSFLLNFGVNSMLELRSGASVGAFYRAYTGYEIMQISAIVPVMVRVNYSRWLSAAAGVSAGFSTESYAADTGTFRSAGLSLGVEWSVLSLRAGDKREFELSFDQGLRFGGTPFQYHQSVVFTYLFVGGSAPGRN